jgi:hypothetical protein
MWMLSSAIAPRMPEGLRFAAMSDPRHPAIPNLVPTFDPDPASAGDAAPFDKPLAPDDVPLDEDDGDAAAYGRDGD